jgi:glutaredoxin|tara:strand:- start:7772 stop:8065 length:294 start_codon:yes stop_codon:yes gene_type:complete
MIIAYILEDCYYSEMANNLLKKNKIKFEKYLVPQDEKIKNEIKKKNKMQTFPQILFKESEDSKIEKIGGCDDLIQYIDIKTHVKDNKLNKNFLKYLI